MALVQFPYPTQAFPKASVCNLHSLLGYLFVCLVYSTYYILYKELPSYIYV